MLTHDSPTRSRLLCKLVRELVEQQHLESLADLTEALKGRCAHLHISWTNDDISHAYRMVGSNTPLVRSRTTFTPAPRSRTMFHVEHPADELSPAAAANLVGELLARFAREKGLR